MVRPSGAQPTALGIAAWRARVVAVRATGSHRAPRGLSAGQHSAICHALLWSPPATGRVIAGCLAGARRELVGHAQRANRVFIAHVSGVHRAPPGGRPDTAQVLIKNLTGSQCAPHRSPARIVRTIGSHRPGILGARLGRSWDRTRAFDSNRSDERRVPLGLSAYLIGPRSRRSAHFRGPLSEGVSLYPDISAGAHSVQCVRRGSLAGRPAATRGRMS